MPTGAAVHYVAGSGHRPLPTAADRPYDGPHDTPRRPRGLDWDALTPACRTCGEKSRRLDRNDICPTCVGPVAPPPVPKVRKPARQRRAGRAARATKPPRPERVYERITLDVDQVAADYAAGMTLQQIADKNGVSHPVIARHLDQAGVARRKQRFAYTAEFLDQVRDLYENNGLSQAKIADRLGLTQKVIQSAMVKAGVRPRLDAVGLSRAGLGGHDIKLNAQQRTEIATRYQAGESGPTLAAAYGVSSVSIYGLLKRAGIERRARR
jgi:transposase